MRLLTWRLEGYKDGCLRHCIDEHHRVSDAVMLRRSTTRCSQPEDATCWRKLEEAVAAEQVDSAATAESDEEEEVAFII
ncbi:hypothetical protein LSTR_LSTR011944 [Laodelphax striatellus]|uniref:Uncharacterized protein n=1 Tax=Laodelphax striatellus TaxID=195883 RepID=A0A482WY46_LAOST|nr:hypothetical protein LSTR_LSTR011944 [Laodelphax striatellus]